MIAFRTVATADDDHSIVVVVFVVAFVVIVGFSITDVLEIEDVQGRKRVAPPPTDQTRGPKWSIFWRGITCGILLRGIEAIFKFRPTSGDTGV